MVDPNDLNGWQHPYPTIPISNSLYPVMNQPTTLDCSLHEPHLYDTRDGRVLRCACCGRVQIEFRRHTLLIDAAEFETLLRSVGEVIEQMEGSEADSWRLAAPTDAGDVSITLGPRDLRALHELLAGAQAMRTLGNRLQAVGEGRHHERPPSSWHP